MMNYDSDDYEIRITKGYAKGGGYDMTGFSDAMDSVSDMCYCIGRYVVPVVAGLLTAAGLWKYIILPILLAIL